MSLVAQSLTYRDPKNSFKMIEWLKKYSNTDDARNYMFWRNTYQVEATSYALMAILNSGYRNSIDAQSIANWLNSKRSFSGSFDSTQDTIVALEGLALFARYQTAIPENVALYCNVSAHKADERHRFKRSLEFHKENALVMQKFKVNADGDMLEFVTRGNGVGLVSIKLKYNVLENPEKLCRFDIDVKVSEWKESGSAGRGEDPDEPELDIGEDWFNSFPSELIEDLALQNNRNKRSAGLFWDDSGNRHGQSLFTKLRNRFKLPSFRFRDTQSFSGNQNRASTRTETVPSSNTDRLSSLSSLSNRQFNTEKNKLSNARLTTVGVSKLILLMEICTRYIPRSTADMSVIEVGILSGYVPVKEDLEEVIAKDDPSRLVSKYELSDRNIIFYLDTIPYGRPYCIQFRMVREHIVANIQAAFVRVYDYYNTGDLLNNADKIPPFIMYMCAFCFISFFLIQITVVHRYTRQLVLRLCWRRTVQRMFASVQSAKIVRIRDRFLRSAR